MSEVRVPLTKLDETLREMALTNWQQFVQLIGDEAILKAKTCLLRGTGNSYGQIAIKLGEDKNNVRHWCGKCEK